MRESQRPSLEKRLRVSDIDSSIVETAGYNEGQILQMIRESDEVPDGMAESFKEDVMYDYYKYLDEGFQDVEGTVDMAITSVKQERSRGARPVENWREHTGNKHAENMAEEVAEDQVDELVDIMKDGEPLIKKAQDEYDSIKENEEDIDWNDVSREIRANLKNRLREKDAKNKIRNIIDSHTEYDYSETEVWRFTEEIIEEITERKADEIVSAMVQAMDSDDIKSEQQAMKEETEKSLLKSTAKSTASEAMAKITAEGITKLAVLVTTAAAGVAL